MAFNAPGLDSCSHAYVYIHIDTRINVSYVNCSCVKLGRMTPTKNVKHLFPVLVVNPRNSESSMLCVFTYSSRTNEQLTFRRFVYGTSMHSGTPYGAPPPQSYGRHVTAQGRACKIPGIKPWIRRSEQRVVYSNPAVAEEPNARGAHTVLQVTLTDLATRKEEGRGSVKNELPPKKGGSCNARRAQANCDGGDARRRYRSGCPTASTSWC